MRLIMLVCVLVFSYAGLAQDSDAEQRAISIRTTFILHILEYSRWHLPPTTPTLCLLESAPYNYLAALQSDEFRDSVNVKTKVLRVDNIEQALKARCSYLFVDQHSERQQVLAGIFDSSNKMITIGETQAFLEGGGLVSLVEEYDKIKIFISREQYEQAPAKFSARLLKFANFVR